jgi:hypothetical protein
MLRGACSAPPSAGRLTFGAACSFSPDWPTPTASPFGSQKGTGPSLETLARLGALPASWPTPTVADGSYSGQPRADGNQSLHHVAGLWPGLELDDEGSAPSWPTPTATDAKASGRVAYSTGITLTDAAVRLWPAEPGTSRSFRLVPTTPKHGASSSPSGRILNPQFVEWLMGWPPGWTDCASAATASFRSWQRAHGASSGSASTEAA